MRSLAILAPLCGLGLAAPAAEITPTPVPTNVNNGLLGGVVSDLSNVLAGVGNGDIAGQDAWSSISSAVQTVTATTTPVAAASAIESLASIYSARPSANAFEYAASLVAEGLTSSDMSSVLGSIDGNGTADVNKRGLLDLDLTANSMNNKNPRNPSRSVYPQKACGDAPYTVDEATLRAAIHIPSGFTYGAKPPVILMPGTGNTGFETFQGNFIPALKGQSYADAVWLNVPGSLLDDSQTNSEFIAYAINYISSIASRNVSVIAWSQGNINTQWAFKYWPSARRVTTTHIAISPDYAGTTMVPLICPEGLPCPLSVLQQRYLGASNFITTLRSENGDSAYVPTTTLYSSNFDLIVQPQQGTGASAFLLDARNVGVTNNEVQTICAGTVAGGFWTHESMLINSLTFALAKDALINGGPGRVSRIALKTVCNQPLTPGLGLAELLLTENSLLIGLAKIITTPLKATTEPATRAYVNVMPACDV
ncbi:alpha/beta-hydrolase [Aureobasidium pullulans EXF-150]|uniref:Alpha/beta-hydrolase n=1 Tax=Aureobasidium pullulans EXF-150 TaxID=1043002 RepID=A0A074XLC8_AURPU|nr:alpha/beta-hydrolase [Aureobasidium pullulans EXF-150]KEQ86288.1 alpha/beta-hydrolase [Aureobasidium pullulans EXF-150]